MLRSGSESDLFRRSCQRSDVLERGLEGWTRWSPETSRSIRGTGWTYERWAHKSSGCVTAILLGTSNTGRSKCKGGEDDVAFIGVDVRRRLLLHLPLANLQLLHGCSDATRSALGARLSASGRNPGYARRENLSPSVIVRIKVSTSSDPIYTTGGQWIRTLQLIEV